jgi:hypothetical protein
MADFAGMSGASVLQSSVAPSIDVVSSVAHRGIVKQRTPKLKALLNRGENAVLDIAESVCAETGTKVFAKVRIADVVQVDGSGISNDLHRYALSAHFDVLVAKDNEAFLAIEFDGSGHDQRNDLKKAPGFVAEL